MIFGLQYALVVAGYAATAFLLGNYMILYTGASQFELGLIFTIQPAVIFVRPIVCSLADRYQSHRAIYLYCSLFSFLCHLPFIVIPFIVEAAAATRQEAASLRILPPPLLQQNATFLTVSHNSSDIIATKTATTTTTTTPDQYQDYKLVAALHSALLIERVRFWLLVVSHFVGCIFFCCMRTLGDVLTVNYCRRIRTEYTKYRKLGPISFGMCSLLLGYINCNEQLLGLPDYVPGFILYSTCHMTLFVFFWLWPEEFFQIVSESQVDLQQLAPLPNSAEIRRHIRNKIWTLISCSGRPARARPDLNCSNLAKLELSGDKRQQQPQQADPPETATKPSYIGGLQQVRIILLLIRQDFRIPLYMLVLVGCGIMGHSVQNFVYVYLAVVCREQHCSSSAISGYIMLGICVTETIAYSISSRYFQFQATRKRKLIKVELALAVLSLHYLILALLVHESAYYFLAETLHGFEFGLMIATGIELGDYFAHEVSLIIPQLIQKGIITERDDLALVRVSLIATMLACFMLVYDGLGGIIGGLLFGYVVDTHGFPFAFKLNALLSALFLALLLISALATRFVRIKPPIAQCSFIQMTMERDSGDDLGENTDALASKVNAKPELDLNRTKFMN